jgi:hypothetical protein
MEVVFADHILHSDSFTCERAVLLDEAKHYIAQGALNPRELLEQAGLTPEEVARELGDDERVERDHRIRRRPRR